MLGLLRLPTGAVRSSGEPAGDHGVLARPGYDEATPNLVDAHAWWTVAGSASDVLAYVAGHLPAYVKPSGSGTGNIAPGFASDSFSLSAIPGMVSERVLAVTVEQLTASTTAVRTDGEAVWITARPSWEQIPAGVHSVTYTARAPTGTGRPGPTSRPIILTGARARQLVTTINRLELDQPGFRSCPAGTDTSVRLRFAASDGSTLAQAVEQPTECASVRLTIGHRVGPALSDYPSVTQTLERLGVIPGCSATQLLPSASPPSRNGAITDRAVAFAFRNRSNSVCRLHGFPKLTLLDASGHTMHTTSDDLGRAIVRREGLASWAVLDPGQSTSFTASFTTCSAPTAARVRITLPHVSQPFALTVGSLTHPLAPCTARSDSATCFSHDPDSGW